MKKNKTLRGIQYLLNLLAGWLNVITSPEGCTAVDARKLREYNQNLAKETWELGNSRDFYKKRCANLQAAQKRMRDPVLTTNEPNEKVRV